MSADIIELHGPVPAGSHAVVHHLPCAIAHDGPAKVNTYFVPAMMPDDKGGTSLRAAFRGRLMDGYKTVLPEGVVGLVVQETGSAAPLGGEPSAASVAPPAASNRSSSSSSSSSAAAAKKPMTAAARRLAAKRKGPVITKGRAGDDDDEEDFGVTFDSDDDDDDEDDGEDGDVFGGSYNDNDDDGDGVGAGGGGVDQPHRRVWRIEGSFKEITYWLHDKPPSESDMVKAAVDWFQIARALHGPAPQ